MKILVLSALAMACLWNSGCSKTAAEICAEATTEPSCTKDTCKWDPNAGNGKGKCVVKAEGGKGYN